MSVAAMPVETRRVRGRRKVRYTSFDDVLADAERLYTAGHRQLGNWSLGMVLKHLGTAMHASVDGGTFRVKWYLRLLGPLVLKRFLVKGPFPAGFKLPRRAAAVLVPGETSYNEGFAAFQQGVERLLREPSRGAHPVVGKLTIAEWDSFHLRHAEMHMSFLVPE